MAGDETKKFDQEDRLIDYAILISKVVENLNNDKLTNHISGQLIRSGTSPALNYGEAQSAESRNDFIYKMKICLKEFRESRVCLKIICRKPLIEDLVLVNIAINETMSYHPYSIRVFQQPSETKKIHNSTLSVHYSLLKPLCNNTSYK